MNIKSLFGLFVLIIFTNGCISEFNAALPSEDAQVLIVDGTIIENTNAAFYLSKSFPINSKGIPNDIFITNANITVIGSNGYKSSPATSLGRGEYKVFVGKLEDDVEYGIQIEYDGDTYQSALSKPLRTPEIDSISWIQPEKYGSVLFRVSTHDTQGEAKFYLWNYTENWETTAYNYTTIFLNPTNSTFYLDYSAPYYYCWRSAASDKFLIGSTESLSENRIINKQFYQQDNPGDGRFSTLYCITVNQKAISRGAYEYFQNKITLNDGMGGLFTPQPSEISGNIVCISNPKKKVMGYIEVTKNTTQKRIFIYPNQITRPFVYSDCSTITQDSIRTIMRENGIVSYKDLYNLDYRPTGNTDMAQYPKIAPTEWSTARCTECTTAGGTKIKPDFWPNDHQ